MQGDLPSLSISLSTPVYVHAQVKTGKGRKKGKRQKADMKGTF